MTRLVITEPAEHDLIDIVDYIAADNPGAAAKVHAAIVAAARRLVDFPALGHSGRVSNTRELVMASLPYLIVYGVGADAINILAVMHMARDLPRLLHQRGKGGRNA